MGKVRNKEKASFDQKIRRNGFNSLRKPPIKILRPLFTLQLLILLERDPFHTPKCINQGQKLRIFAILTSIYSFTMERVNLNAKTSIFALSFSFFEHEIGSNQVKLKVEE